MNIKDILRTIGTAALSTSPLGVAAIPLINKFLPVDQALKETSTGTEAKAAIANLSSKDRASIELAEINLTKADIEGQTQRYIAMTKADGQKTRAKVVMLSMYALIAISLIFITAISYVYGTENAESAFNSNMAWVFITISAPFAYVVRAYFGDLKTETTSRHASINNQMPKSTGLTGIIEAVRRK